MPPVEGLAVALIVWRILARPGRRDTAAPGLRVVPVLAVYGAGT